VWSRASGQGFSLGLDFFGAASADTEIGVELSILVPLTSLLALRMRPMLYDGSGDQGGTSIGAKVEIVFRSAVLMNFVRVYAGGGPAVFYGLSGRGSGKVDGNWFPVDLNGNWFTGADVFVDPRFALHWEFGTSGGAFATGAGPYIDVGLTLYPF
jgi:hypothetical protein